jgi:RNA polymerase sigma factor (sigma-70 family)
MLQAGDLAGAEGLYKRYKDHIHDFAARIVGTTSAEDIAQLTFVRAIERIGELRDPKRVRSWLYSIALNLARDEVAKGPAAYRRELVDTTPAEGPAPDDVAVRHAREALVRAAVASMEPTHRTVLHLSVRHDLSTREIAAVTGESVARASLQLNRARSSFRHAVRSLVVAQSRTHCDRLAAMVPPAVDRLTPKERRSVEHHMKHCATCQGRAAVLTAPIELLGGIALLPLPVSVGTDWLHRATPAPPAQPAAAHLGWTARLRTPAALTGGAAVLLLFGGGIAILHANQHPAHVASRPHALPSLPLTGDPSFTITPDTAAPTLAPTPTPEPTPTPTPSGAQDWADAQALMRSARGYHVTYGSYYVYPQGGTPGNPVHFDLSVQPSGDFLGTYSAIDGYLGQFDIRRQSGVLSVRHINTVGNMGIPGAPEDALQFFDISQQQADALGDSWLPLTASAQRPAATVLAAALGPYVSPAQFAAVTLAQPAGPIDVEPGLDAGSTLLRAGSRTLTYRLPPGALLDYSTPNFDVRVDSLST